MIAPFYEGSTCEYGVTYAVSFPLQYQTTTALAQRSLISRSDLCWFGLRSFDVSSASAIFSSTCQVSPSGVTTMASYGLKEKLASVSLCAQHQLSRRYLRYGAWNSFSRRYFFFGKAAVSSSREFFIIVIGKSVFFRIGVLPFVALLAYGAVAPVDYQDVVLSRMLPHAASDGLDYCSLEHERGEHAYGVDGRDVHSARHLAYGPNYDVPLSFVNRSDSRFVVLDLRLSRNENGLF